MPRPTQPTSLAGAADVSFAAGAQAIAGSTQATTVLGFDFGTRRIGVAVGNCLTQGARALEVVANNSQGPDWQRLDVLLRDWHPDALLVGLPLTMDGAEQGTSRAARAFAASLGERYRVPLHLVDERLSSQEAARRFAEQRARGETRRKHAQELDAVAAQVIVETWLTGVGSQNTAHIIPAENIS
jgi:putative holliday junction resolvase